MKLLVRTFLSLLLLFLIVAALAYATLRVALGQAFTNEPLVPQFEKAGIDDLKRIKALVLQVSQQSQWNSQLPRSIELSAKDINLAIGQFAPHQIDLPRQTFARVNLNGEQGDIQASAALNSFIQDVYQQQRESLSIWQRSAAQHFIGLLDGRWANLSAPVSIVQKGETITLVPGPLSVGNITLSQSLSDTIYDRAMQEAKKQRGYSQITRSWKNIKSLRIENDLLKASFVVPAGNDLPINNLQALVLSPRDVELADFYSRELQKLPRRGPLIAVLAKLFKVAEDRSTKNANPVAENRGVLLALSRAYGGDQLVALVGQRDPTAALRLPKPYTIYRRTDLAQHLVLSSGAYLLADENIAELIGVDKELSDLMGGRRISAWDLLADKAGIKLAQRATANARTAREVQVFLGRANKDSDLLPDLGPDFSGSNDRFDASQLDELNEMVTLYLDQHRLFR